MPTDEVSGGAGLSGLSAVLLISGKVITCFIYKSRGVDKNLNGNYYCSEVHLKVSMTGMSCHREGKTTIQCFPHAAVT